MGGWWGDLPRGERRAQGESSLGAGISLSLSHPPSSTTDSHVPSSFPGADPDFSSALCSLKLLLPTLFLRFCGPNLEPGGTVSSSYFCTAYKAHESRQETLSRGQIKPHGEVTEFRNSMKFIQILVLVSCSHSLGHSSQPILLGEGNAMQPGRQQGSPGRRAVPPTAEKAASIPEAPHAGRYPFI